MGQKDRIAGYKELVRCRGRAVKAWSRCRPSVKRRKRLLRFGLAVAAAGELLWAAGGGRTAGWLRECRPHILYIEERQAVGPESPWPVWEPEKERSGAGGETKKRTVKKGISILLEEKCIRIFRIEESPEESSGESPGQPE